MKVFFRLIYRFFRKLDKQLFICVTACSCFGVLMLYSMSVNSQTQSITSARSIGVKTQFFAMILGIGVALALSLFDYHKLAKLWFLYAPAAFGLTLLTFTPLGFGREGADDLNWLDLGIISLQPSEILKIAFILSFAYHASKTQENFNKPQNVLLLCLHGGAPIALVTLQGDYGTAIVFAAIFASIMFVAGLSWKYIVVAFAALPVVALLLWNFVLQKHHKDRIQILFNPDLDPTGVGNQQRQGKIALGSGQLFGKGLFDGQYSYVSEQHNDFIFSYVGQTVGFVGCVVLCAVLCCICIRLISNASGAKDKLGQLICTGVFALVFIHCILNIGMVLGVMPVIGVPLPFVSAGGTAILSMLVAIGLAFSVYSHSGKNASLLYFGS